MSRWGNGFMILLVQRYPRLSNFFKKKKPKEKKKKKQNLNRTFMHSLSRAIGISSSGWFSGLFLSLFRWHCLAAWQRIRSLVYLWSKDLMRYIGLNFIIRNLLLWVQSNLYRSTLTDNATLWRSWCAEILRSEYLNVQFSNVFSDFSKKKL